MDDMMVSMVLNVIGLIWAMAICLYAKHRHGISVLSLTNDRLEALCLLSTFLVFPISPLAAWQVD